MDVDTMTSNQLSDDWTHTFMSEHLPILGCLLLVFIVVVSCLIKITCVDTREKEQDIARSADTSLENGLANISKQYEHEINIGTPKPRQANYLIHDNESNLSIAFKDQSYTDNSVFTKDDSDYNTTSFQTDILPRLSMANIRMSIRRVKSLNVKKNTLEFARNVQRFSTRRNWNLNDPINFGITKDSDENNLVDSLQETELSDGYGSMKSVSTISSPEKNELNSNNSSPMNSDQTMKNNKNINPEFMARIQFLDGMLAKSLTSTPSKKITKELSTNIVKIEDTPNTSNIDIFVLENEEITHF